MKTSLFVITALLAFAGCRNNQPNEQDPASKVIARVGDKKLYAGDVSQMLPANVSQTDSANMIRHYAETWVRKELMLDEARNKTKIDEAEIERKVEDYRYSLTLYEFEKQYLQKNLDTLVSKEAIRQYYQNNTPNFNLKQTIVRAVFVKVPKKLSQLGRIKSLVQADDSRSRKELHSLCLRFAEQYHLNDTLWVDFEKLTSGTPWMSVASKTQFAQQTSLVEAGDESSLYLLRIKQSKTPGQNAPVEYVADQIRSLLLNQRKVNLVQNLEKNIYEQAKAKKAFEIY